MNEKTMTDSSCPLAVVKFENAWALYDIYASKIVEAGFETEQDALKELSKQDEMFRIIDSRVMYSENARASYDRHCVDPVKAAEEDLLGECVGLLKKLEPVMWQMRRLVKQKTNSETPECDKVYEELHAALAKCKGGE